MIYPKVFKSTTSQSVRLLESLCVHLFVKDRHSNKNPLSHTHSQTSFYMPLNESMSWSIYFEKTAYQLQFTAAGELKHTVKHRDFLLLMNKDQN